MMMRSGISFPADCPKKPEDAVRVVTGDETEAATRAGVVSRNVIKRATACSQSEPREQLHSVRLIDPD
jgi:hypothetical protein